MNKNTLDLKITPVRLVVVISSLLSAGLSGWFGWDIPIFFFILPIILAVFLTQPKATK